MNRASHTAVAIAVLACLFSTAPVLAQHPQVVNSVLVGVGILGFDTAGNAVVPGTAGLQRMRPDGTVVWQSSLLYGAQQIAFDGNGNLYVLSPSCVSACPVPTTTFGTGSFGVLFGKVNAAGDAFVWLDRLTNVSVAFPANLQGMQVDTAGNVYLTGGAICSFSTTSGSFQPQCAPSGQSPAFAAKVDSTGANLLYATFLRGTTQNSENAISMAVDGLGSAYVLGRGASDWPTTPGAFETGCSTAPNCYFVAKLSSDGSSLAYSTFFNDGVPNSIAADPQGRAYLSGQTTNMNFPTTPGSAEPTFLPWTLNPNPLFVVKFTPDGTALVYSTYVSLLDQTTDNEDRHHNVTPPRLSLDSAGDAYVYGLTKRPGVQTVNAIQSDDNHPNDGQGAIAELNPQGSGYLFSTYLGGTGGGNFIYDYPVTDVAVSGDGLIHITGISIGNNFPALTSQGRYPHDQTVYMMALQPSGTAAVPILFDASGPSIPEGALEAVLPGACAGSSCGSFPPNSQGAVYLGNYGAAPLAISSIATTTGDFSQTNDCPASLAAGARCIVTVTFSPTAIGTRNGTLTLTGGGVTQNFALSSTGYAAQVQSSPSALYFGVQTVGTTSAAQTLTITNTGNTDLVFSSITVQGQFSQTNTCGTTIGQTNSCTVHVAFAPTASGQQDGTLTLTSNAVNSPVVIQLHGGVNADFVIAPPSGGTTSQTVTAGQMATYNLTLTAVAGFSGTVSLSCAGAPTGATCAVSPHSMNLSGNSAVAFTVSVPTTARSIVGGPGLDTPGGSPLEQPGWLWLWVMSLFVAGRWFVSRKRRYAMAIGLLGAVALFATLAAVGCGGGSSSSMGTPPGSYTIAVNASSGSTSHSQNLTLTVQ